MSRRRLGLLALFAVVAVVMTLHAQEPYPTIPPPPIMPPIAEEYTRPLTGEWSVTLGNVAAASHRIQVNAPYVRAVGRPASDGTLRFSLVHVRGVRVVSRATDIVVPIDLFTKLTDQRIDVERLRIESAAITRRRRSGIVHWRFDGIDVDIRDVAIGGARTERLRLAHGDMRGEIEGWPVVVQHADARVRRERNHFTMEGDVQLAASEARVGVQAVRDREKRVNVVATTANYSELHAFFDVLPHAGTGAIDASIVFADDHNIFTVRRAEARLNTSHVAARGVLRRGVGASVHDAVIDITRLHADDLAAAYDVELPGGGQVHGRATVTGQLDQGARVDATLHRLANGDSTRVRIDGLVRDDAGAWLDLHAHAEPVRAADTVLVVALRGRGRPDSLAITGAVTLARNANSANGGTADPDALQDVRAELDATMVETRGTRTMRGSVDLSATITDRTTGLPARVGAVASGIVALEEGGRVDIEVRADSLPLRLIPAPDAVHDVSGVAIGVARITGTIEEPRLNGAFDVRDGGLRVQRFGTTLAGLHGIIHVADDVAHTDGLAGDMGGGPFRVLGSVRWRGDAPTVDATVQLERGRIVDNDSLRATASAELRVTGAIATPRLHGNVRVHEGHFDEDMLKEPAPLDIDDPPHAATAAEVPWIRNSRLVRAESMTRERTEQPRPAADVAVRLLIERGFRIIDEDSEMFGDGDIVFRTDSTGLIVEGTYRIVGGEYNNFGERFRVLGGLFHFPGAGTVSRVSLRGRHDDRAPIGTDLGSDRSALDFYPPLESFAIGSLSGIIEEVRRMSLLPETEGQLAGALLYRQPAEPVTGQRTRRYWTSDAGESFVGPRARSQAAPLLWAYTADEAYDWLPLSRAYLQAGTVAVGPPFPGRTVIAGVIGGGIRSRAFELDLRQPLAGGAWPGLQLRYETGAWRLAAFNEPRFRAVPAAGEDARGFTQQRRNGVRLRWWTEW